MRLKSAADFKSVMSAHEGYVVVNSNRRQWGQRWSTARVEVGKSRYIHAILAPPGS